jgi:hypothetical protein
MNRIIIDGQPFDSDEEEMDAFTEGLARAKETNVTKKNNTPKRRQNACKEVAEQLAKEFPDRAVLVVQVHHNSHTGRG